MIRIVFGTSVLHLKIITHEKNENNKFCFYTLHGRNSNLQLNTESETIVW